MSKPLVFVDIFREIVKKVSTNLTVDLQAIDQNITGVHYDHGHPLEVIETLTQKDSSNVHRFNKYPLVALFQDFSEKNSSNPSQGIEPVFHVAIINATRPDYKASERYTKNFKPILYPIYDELLNQINKSTVFFTTGKSSISHIKTDRLYWGREGLWGKEGNIFNDWVDAIEIKDLKLKTYLNNC